LRPRVARRRRPPTRRANLGASAALAALARPLPPCGRDFFTQQRFIAPLARREAKRHDLARARQRGDLARLARRQVALAPRLVANADDEAGFVSCRIDQTGDRAWCARCTLRRQR
jgi:hypothetical protein